MGLHSKASEATSELVQSAVMLRSQGPLSAQDFTEAKRARMRLGFDPVQNGWVRADSHDDFDLTARRAGWGLAKNRGQIALRAWTKDDVSVFRALLNNPRVWAHLPNPFPGDITLDAADELISLSRDEDLHIVRAICVDRDPIGQVRLDFGGQEPELSYWLGEQYWRKGFGSRAVSTFVAECFASNPSLDHMIARVKPVNTGSLRILEKAGFFREGRSNASPDWIILRCDRPD